jgi:hypothetical protein
MDTFRKQDYRQRHGNHQQVTIHKLSATTLEIKSRYDWDGDGDDDTVIERYTSDPN